MSSSFTYRVVRPLRAAALVLTIAAGVSVPAAAQTWPERVLISVNGAFQPTKNAFDYQFEFRRNVENGSTSVSSPSDGGFVFDAGVGYRLVKNFGVGVAFSSFTHDNTAATTSQFPHPFFFNQPRQVTGDVPNVTRTERAVHVQAMALWPATRSLRIVISGGPSFFNVEQDVVTEVTITETYPFDTANFSGAHKDSAKESGVGFNVGADAFWIIAPHFGVGGLVRFSRTSVDLTVATNRTVSVDAGGVYAGGGLRILF
jgi:hypothetical protein